MSTSTVTEVTSQAPSARSLRETPLRAMKFLRVVGIVPAVRAALESRGYTATEHHLAWGLVHKVYGYAGPPTDDAGNQSLDAIASINDAIDPTFRIGRAALDRSYPAQSAFVFQDLEVVRGVQAVPAMQRFLDRLEDLENGADRKSSRKKDHAALEVLAQRGITKAERTRLAGLVVQAETPADKATPNASDSEQVKNLTALHAWLVDWSETAKIVIKRRDYLHRMGIGSRRIKKGAPSGDGASTGNEDSTPPPPAAALPMPPTAPALTQSTVSHG